MGIVNFLSVTLFLQHLIMHTEQIICVLVFPLQVFQQLILLFLEILQLSLILFLFESVFVQYLRFGLIQGQFVLEVLYC